MDLVILPRIGVVNLDDLPVDFEGRVTQGFLQFSKDTAENFRFVDKLFFIDKCRESLRGNKDSGEAVRELIVENEKFSLDEYGELPDRDMYWSMEFMEHIYDTARDRARLYDSGNKSERWKVEATLWRIIEALAKL